MKSNYLFNSRIHRRAAAPRLLVLVMVCLGLGLMAQQNHSTKVVNDKQLLEALENPEVRAVHIEPGYYATMEKQLSGAARLVKPENNNGSRSFECSYVIQQSSTCFEPVPPSTYDSDTARAFTLDLFGCGCCPPNDAGIWSVTSGPGNVIFDDPINDTTEFSVDAPGVYALRYTWPAPWNSYVETIYFFYITYTADLQADDTCALSTMVHFEYSSLSPAASLTLEWTLNGAPYAGPAANPDGDTVDFVLTVPVCGEYILEATLSTDNCDPITVSDTILLRGEDGPVISGVGADTTIICPETPVFSEPTVDDSCDRNAVMTFVTDSIPGDCPDHYTLVRTWTAVNDCGDTTTASQTIIHLPNPNPEILLSPLDIENDTIVAGCDEIVIIPFPVIETPCGPAEVFYTRSDGGIWTDPFGPGNTEVCYWGISPCGYSTDTLCLLVMREICDSTEQFCSLTQGYYGNAGGTFCNGMGTADLIDSLLSLGDLVVGSGGNTMTFSAGESGCVIDLLPGGGPAKTISGANTCASHPGIQTKKGSIHNVLLAQTITLGLNLRLSGDLGALEIFSDTLVAAPSSGCDGEGDTISGPFAKYPIPMSVYNVLSQNGTIVATVDDLFALANTALGGGAIGATTLSAISDAASAINEGFDECAFGQFQQPLYPQSLAAEGGNMPSDEAGASVMRISPNPFSASASIEFTPTVSGHAVVEVYTITGARVAVLFDGQVEAGSTRQFNFAGDPAMKQMTYICVIRTAGETRFERMLMMR